MNGHIQTDPKSITASLSMKQTISKERTRKVRNRERHAAKGNVEQRNHRLDHPAIGAGIMAGLWIATVAVHGAEFIFHSPLTAERAVLLTGDAIFILIGLLASALFLKIARPNALKSSGRTLLLSIIALLAVVLAKGVLYISVHRAWIPASVGLFLLPFALAPLLTAILTEVAAAVAIGIWTSLVMAIMMGGSFVAFLTGIVATILAARISGRVRTRSKVFRTGLLVGTAQLACVAGLTVAHWETVTATVVLHQAGACLISGFLAAALALLFLPLFESVFRITTDITLLELSDMGHPLLQRLAMEAPGTYHHSLVVASLAQAAADEIGANSLLTRVSAYYHDIGKLTKPDFFAENIRMQTNPHDDLPPSMSTLVITAHVKEGLSLALLHKLPEPILAVIREHHGTSLLSYFHHKAKSQLELEFTTDNGSQTNDSQRVREVDFRYPGPRPATRESAIVGLADAVEAASRSMEKTTPTHIENLVSDIVGTRLRDGQLDNCELQLSELTCVKRSFVFTLTNMLHGRVPYPKDEHRNNKQSKPVPSTKKEPRDAGAVSDGQGASPVS